jgi:sporulation protein YabP
METMDNKQNQLILIKDRILCEIDGVKKLDSFDKKEFLVDTNHGYVHVKGNNLSLGLMDMEKGKLTINGTIDSIGYLSKQKNESKESFFTKLFK